MLLKSIIRVFSVPFFRFLFFLMIPVLLKESVVEFQFIASGLHAFSLNLLLSM